MAIGPTGNGSEKEPHKYSFNIESEDVQLPKNFFPHSIQPAHPPSLLCLWSELLLAQNYSESNSRYLVTWAPGCHEYWCSKVQLKTSKSIILLHLVFLLGTVEFLKVPWYRKEVGRIFTTLLREENLLFFSGHNFWKARRAAQHQ